MLKHTAVALYINPRNNLAHRVACERSWHDIDLLLACDYNFADAVALLELWLHLHQTKRSTHVTTPPK